MVKWHILLGGIAGIIVSIFHFTFIMQITRSATSFQLDYSNSDISILEAINGAAYTSMMRITPFLLAILLSYFLMIYFFITLFPLKKWFISLGAILSIFGVLTQGISWTIGIIYDPPFLIGGVLFILGWLLIGFGMISFYKHTLLIAIFGPIMSFATLFVFFIHPFLILIGTSNLTNLELESMKNNHFLGLGFYKFLFFAFVILFSLFFKERFYFKGEREEISVLDQTAFASYIPDEEESRSRKKRKQKVSKKEYDFNF